MNYTDLETRIQVVTENNEATFVAEIPFFVRRAEERIYRDIKLPMLRNVNTALTTTAGTRTVTMPVDFISVDSISVIDGSGNYHTLTPKEPDFIREAYGTTSYQGLPKFYALRDNQTILLGPTPDNVYSFELTYTYTPASIVDAGTSWLGTNATNALLYASLIEAYIFMKGEQDIMAIYDARLKEALGSTKILGEGKNRTDEFRHSPPTSPNAMPA